MQMICIGECGSFNPLLLQDLTDVQNELPAAALTQRGTPAQRSSQLVDKKGTFDSDIPRTTSENHEYCLLPVQSPIRNCVGHMLCLLHN